MIDRVVRYFGAGAAGGLLNSMVVWLFSSTGYGVSPHYCWHQHMILSHLILSGDIVGLWSTDMPGGV